MSVINGAKVKCLTRSWAFFCELCKVTHLADVGKKERSLFKPTMKQTTLQSLCHGLSVYYTEITTWVLFQKLPEKRAACFNAL